MKSAIKTAKQLANAKNWLSWLMEKQLSLDFGEKPCEFCYKRLGETKLPSDVDKDESWVCSSCYNQAMENFLDKQHSYHETREN